MEWGQWLGTGARGGGGGELKDKPPTGDLAPNPGMCRNQEWTRNTFFAGRHPNYWATLAGLYIHFIQQSTKYLHENVTRPLQLCQSIPLNPLYVLYKCPVSYPMFKQCITLPLPFFLLFKLFANTGRDKSRFTVVLMENNTIINNTRINCFEYLQLQTHFCPTLHSRFYLLTSCSNKTFSILIPTIITYVQDLVETYVDSSPLHYFLVWYLLPQARITGLLPYSLQKVVLLQGII